MMDARRERRLRFPKLPDLAAELQQRVQQIPPGRVTTYGDLARALGDRHAAVWVSRWLGVQGRNADVPWHRVVRVAGEIPHGEEQARRLLSEGVAVRSARGQGLCVDVGNRFEQFVGSPPLRRLAGWSQREAIACQERPLIRRPEIVAGLDVAYGRESEATAAAVAVETRTGRVINSVVITLPVGFPYIPGFLSFREIPAQLAALRALEENGLRADVVFVDGQGRLHPRRSGIATAFATVTGRPTIGVAKSRLCGRVESVPTLLDACRVTDGDELLGYAVRGRKTAKPIYVSVGGWITLEESLSLTGGLFQGRRLPVPIHEADRLSKRAARPKESQTAGNILGDARPDVGSS
jgi:deoxyribonuclease V